MTLQIGNLTEAMQNACHALGVTPRQVPADGMFHRADVEGKNPGNEAATIKMFPDGEGGTVRNFVTDETLMFWAKSDVTLTPAELAERKQRAAAERLRADNELAERRSKAAQLAAKVWKAATPVTDNPYLHRKKEESTNTLREIPLSELVKLISYHPQAKGEPFTGEAILIVPVSDQNRQISTIEMIDEVGSKAGLKDGRKQGCFWSTGKLPTGDSTALTLGVGEGVATMLSYSRASDNIGIAALSCGNLKAVADFFRLKYPQAKIDIISDTGNGEQSATEAAAAVKGRLFKPELPEGSIGSDLNDLYCEAGIEEARRQLEAAAATASPTESPTTAETEGHEPDTALISTEQRLFPVKSFPLGVLPDPFSSLAVKIAKALQIHPEVIAMSMLVISSGVIGNAVALQVKKGWEIVCFLWWMLIADTGYGKSHGLDVLMQPVKNRQGKEAIRHKKLMDDYSSELAEYKAHKKDREPPKEPPPMKHYHSQNFTIEALIPMFQAWARGLIICVDELAGLFKGLGQYKSGGNDTEQILSLFNSADLKSDRKSGCGYVRNSGAAVIGGIQHGILPQVFGDADYVSGLVYRILPMVVDHFPAKFNLDCVSDADATTWADFIEWAYNIPLVTDTETGKVRPLKLTLEPDALEAWRIFHDRYKGAEPFVSAKFRGYLPKLRTYCLKFVTILHVMRSWRYDPFTSGEIAPTVSAGTVSDAVLLADYFAGQAQHLIRGAAKEQNPYHGIVKSALQSLKAEVTGGKLLLSKIRDRMNETLETDMQIDGAGGNKKIASWLREIGLTVTTGTDNKAALFWEDEKIIP